ncbi:glycosyltransferase family 2 protein [Steroidobacter sp. S1-65]|uniref:Glycosyltransferase family 2 protein n=1 Tax=Steroidobacter gossypii TaxID=2805490 RepID=A0ABS1WQD7_9GAMM|nr:glycosyltransferase family 2 protein [Steroidobacter gossypii]MBM0103183.1 glycosyltransferase family 2 protein [Steroidobacter gossypii]
MKYSAFKTVSVVIPAYNSRDTIQQAIATARAQTLRPTQIVVVDDCSKDDTIQQAEAVAGPDLLVVRSPKNGGGGAARNRGIDHSTGDVVAFLDADDLWAPNKLANQLATLRTQTREMFCFTAVEQVNEYGEKHILPKREPLPGGSLADYMLKSGNIMQTSSLMVPRHLLDKCRFNEQLRRFQDLDFVLTLGEAGVGAVFCPQPLVEWRNVGNPKRVSANPDPSVMRTFLSHHPQLTLSQRLGLEIRSVGPTPGAAGKLRWSWRLALSVCSGALALPNAVSLLLKHSLGLRYYGALRSRLGARS